MSLNCCWRLGRSISTHKDRYGQTALLAATKEGHEGVIKLLLATGKVDVNAKDIEGKTTLSRAAARGSELSLNCCWRLRRSMSTREKRTVELRWHALPRSGARPSSSCCLRQERSMSTRKKRTVERRWHGLPRTSTRLSLSCCLPLRTSMSTRKIRAARRRCHALP